MADADLSLARFLLARLAAGEATRSSEGTLDSRLHDFFPDDQKRGAAATPASAEDENLLRSFRSSTASLRGKRTSTSDRLHASRQSNAAARRGQLNEVEIAQTEIPRKRRPGRCRRQKSHFDSSNRGRLVARISICRRERTVYLSRGLA